MFDHSADIYDAVYHWKDYSREAERIREIVNVRKRSAGNSLLDVACGTGAHIRYLSEWFAVEGLDLDAGLLDVARERHPNVVFHCADMTEFDLGRRYDVVVCLFSAIGYARGRSGLRSAIASMERHVAPGGVLIVEPWIRDGDFVGDHMSATYIDRDDLKISRMSFNTIEPGEENPVSVMNFYYQIGRPNDVVQFTERHELGLFRPEDYERSFSACGLLADFDAEGLTDRGLYIAAKSI